MVAAAVGLLFLIVLLGVVFLESGADSGRVALEPAAAYARGTVTRVAERGFYVVRLANGDFLAISDLDAANRAAADRRCRVAPIPATDPELAGLIARYRAAFSPPAAGSTLIFREDCRGALYDLAGVRVDEGPNLDRFETSIDGQDRLVVNTARRSCSQRTAAALVVKQACAK